MILRYQGLTLGIGCLMEDIIEGNVIECLVYPYGQLKLARMKTVGTEKSCVLKKACCVR